MATPFRRWSRCLGPARSSGAAPMIYIKAQVGADTMAKPARLLAVEHGTREGAGEQRAQRERASAHAGGEPPAQPPQQRGPGGQDQPGRNHEDTTAVRP